MHFLLIKVKFCQTVREVSVKNFNYLFPLFIEYVIITESLLTKYLTRTYLYITATSVITYYNNLRAHFHCGRFDYWLLRDKY